EFFLLITESELQLAIDAKLAVGPEDSQFLNFSAQGYMLISDAGIAARLDLTREGELPEGMGIAFDAQFKLVMNTTGAEVEYTIGGDTIKIPKSAPALGSDLTIPADATAPPADYFLIQVDGKLTAMGGAFTLDGLFFILISEDEFQ